MERWKIYIVDHEGRSYAASRSTDPPVQIWKGDEYHPVTDFEVGAAVMRLAHKQALESARKRWRGRKTH